MIIRRSHRLSGTGRWKRRLPLVREIRVVPLWSEGAARFRLGVVNRGFRGPAHAGFGEAGPTPRAHALWIRRRSADSLPKELTRNSGICQAISSSSMYHIGTILLDNDYY